MPKALGEAGPCMALLWGFGSCLPLFGDEDIAKVQQVCSSAGTVSTPLKLRDGCQCQAS